MKTAKKAKEVLKSKFYIFYRCFYKIPKSLFYYKNERRLLKGKTFQHCNRKSLIYFTTHKCASTFIYSVFSYLSNQSCLIHADLDGYINNLEKNHDLIYSKEIFLKNAFRTTGFIYGPIRRYRNVPNMEQYNVVLMLRDPRDVLVSMYFSLLYSHSTTSKKLKKSRKKYRNFTIDSFVLDNLDYYRKVYEEYLDAKNKNENIFFFSYEYIFQNPKTFIKSLGDLVGIEVGKSYMDKLVEDQMKFPSKEDIYSHKRSGRPGQYKSKLRSDTVEILNNDLAHVLNGFGCWEI